jgi:hypothetical protein
MTHELWNLVPAGTRADPNGSAAEQAVAVLCTVPQSCYEGRVVESIFALGSAQGLLCHSGLIKDRRAGVIGEQRRKSQLPPPAGIETIKARFHMRICCSHCNNYHFEVSHTGWAPTFLSGKEGHLVAFPLFDPEDRLANIDMAVSFSILDTMYDFGDHALAVLFEDYLLCPDEVDAEKLAFLVSIFREAGWTVLAEDGYASAWAEHAEEHRLEAAEAKTIQHDDEDDDEDED